MDELLLFAVVGLGVLVVHLLVDAQVIARRVSRLEVWRRARALHRLRAMDDGAFREGRWQR